MSRLSDAQRDALLRLAQAWCRGRPQPWDEIRPQTRDALRRAGLADRGILLAGLYALFLAGPAVGAWAAQLRRVSDAALGRDAYLTKWWRLVPKRQCPAGTVPVVTVADLRDVLAQLAPLEGYHAEAQAEADRLLDLARAEVRAALRVEVADV